MLAEYDHSFGDLATRKLGSLGLAFFEGESSMWGYGSN